MHFDAKNFSPTHSWQQWWKSSIHCGVQLRENGLPFCWGIFFEENYDWFCPNLAKKKKKSALGKTFPSINSVMRERKVLTIRPAIHQKSPLKYELVKITNHNFSGLWVSEGPKIWNSKHPNFKSRQIISKKTVYNC